MAEISAQAFEPLETETPFDTPVLDPVQTGVVKPANPVTTQIASLALMEDPGTGDTVDIMNAIDKARNEAVAAAESAQEEALRSQIAVKRASRKRGEVRTNIPNIFGTQLYKQSDEYAAQVASDNLAIQHKTAMEREAIERIQDLAAAGDSTQARILLNRLKPETADSAAVWQDNITKSLLLSQLAERFKQEDDQEGWLAAAYTGLVSMFQPSSFSYLGNVDDGVGAFMERNPLTRFFTPGQDLQNQAHAIWKMNADELAEYLPELEANFRSNSNYLGVSNPDKLVELISYFQQPLGDDAATSHSAWANVETALTYGPGVGIVPYRLAGKSLSLPFNMVRAGARNEAANAVASAFDGLMREGAESAAKAGINEETIIDNMMPSMINPEKSVADLNISLSTDVNKVSAAAEQLVKEWTPRETERVANTDELQKAISAKLDELTVRYGSPVKDYDVIRTELSDGTHTYAIKATMGDPRTNGLFATEAEALGWRLSHGFEEGVAKLDAPEPRIVHPREEGYTDVVYHGTVQTKVEGDLRGTQFGMFGDGVYVTTAPKHAEVYAGDLTKARSSSKSFQDGANVLPLLINGEKIFGFQGAARNFTAGEVKELYKAAGVKLDTFGKTFTRDLADEDLTVVAGEKIIWSIAESVKKQSKKVDDGSFVDPYNALRERLEAKGYHGHLGASGEYDSFAIYDGANVKGLFERKTIQDPSGGWANVIEVDVPETAFYTHLQVPTQGAASRFLKNASQTSDQNVYSKGLIADQKHNKFQKQINAELRSAYGALTKKEKLWIEQVLAKGENESMWFTPQEFDMLVERAMGKPPTERMRKAYERYRVLNDAEFLLRNDAVYREKVVRGMESVKFKAFDEEQDIDAFVNYAPQTPPRSRVYNLSDDVHYAKDKPLDQKRLNDLRARGYILVRTEKPIKLGDGTSVDHFIGKRSDILVNRLRRDQLNYKPGGHRIYESKYQVKQAAYLTQPDTGSKTLATPNTFIMAPTVRDARRWASIMNEARIAAKNGARADALDVIFKGQKGFPTGEEFLEKMNAGLIDKDEPFEALFDRDVPSVYKHQGMDLESVLGEEALRGTNGYFRTTGRMYYSGKGEHMLDHTGELAPTIDPFEAQSQALFNVTRLASSFGDFKVSSIERWVNKYREYLNLRNLPEQDARSTYAVFNKATPMDGIDFDLKQQMLGQRETIKRILGFETELDRNYRHWMRSTAEWIIGDSDNIAREKMSKGVFWLYENNPVSFLRGLAFDLKLGMFNIGQFFIQSSTMASAIALNPRHGRFGLPSAVSTMSYLLSKGNENVLEQLTKNGAHRLAGFADGAEYKAYVREANKSGFFDLNDTHVMVNDLGPEKTFGSVRGGAQQVREMGRWFFYNVEVMNRLVAHRIAYGEALEQFGKAQWDNFEFQEFIARRAENYSFNMSNTSKSWWQTGLLSIPTQFWSYNVRMLEALLGKNFTGPQKLRLLGAQVAMAGTAGVPIVAGITDMVKANYGVEPDIDSMAGVLHRGLADYMIYEMFGADVNVGERWGTGSWSSDLVRDIFGYSEFNNKTFAEIAGGATYSISTQALKSVGSAFDVAMRWMSAESGAEEIDMTGDEIMKMFRQISSVNNTLKAWQVYNYGIFTSAKGKVLADDIPSTDAVFVAMGFAPNAMNEMTVMTGYLKNRQESIDDAAKQITAWRQEALSRPDLFEENRKKVNAFVQFLPVDIRRDVLRRAHRNTDPSIYAGIEERFDKTRTREQMLSTLEDE